MNTINEYAKQAQDFLQSTGVNLRIRLSNTKTAPWDKRDEDRNHYLVTLSRKGQRMTFDFFGSINDAASGREPNSYDVLSCISSDYYTPDSFAEFCGEYGYDQDSITALKMFKRCDRFAKRLQAFFTEQEAQQLSEIA